MQPNVATADRQKATLICINLRTLLVTRYERGLPGQAVNLGHATLGGEKEAHATLASEAGRAVMECYRKTGRLE